MKRRGNQVTPFGRPDAMNQNLEPCVDMEEQPQPHSIRFRYASEGNSHGGLQGISSQRGNKTYPTIVIRNHHGPVKIVVELIAKDMRSRILPHAHELIGKGCEHGVYSWKHLVDSPHCQIVFRHLSVQHVTKKTLVETLQRRLLMQKNDFPDKYEPTGEMESVRDEAAQLSKSLPMNSARLCFRVFLLDKLDQPKRQLKPAVSDPIFDAKSPSAALLKICRIDRHAGGCQGGDEVFLLCDRVQKGDIDVEFYETDDNEITWSAKATFTANDIHRQFAIVFTTPPYRDQNIEHSVDVSIRLYRPSDQEMSEPVKFTYRPNMERDELDRKRRKTLNFQLPDEMDDVKMSRGSAQNAQSALNLPSNFFPSKNESNDSGLSRLQRATLASDVESDSIPTDDSGGSGMVMPPAGQSLRPLSPDDISLLETTARSESDSINSARIEKEFGERKFVTNFANDPEPEKTDSTKGPGPEKTDSTKGPGPEKTDSTKGPGPEKTDSTKGPGPEKTDSTKGPSHESRVVRKAITHYATTGNIRIMLYDLVDYLDVENEDGDSPLGLAIIHGRVEAAVNMAEVAGALAPKCLKHQNRLGQSILHLCVISKCHRVLRYLLGLRAHKANKFRIMDLPLKAQDCSGNTFLHTAVLYEDHAALKALKTHLSLKKKNLPKYDDLWLDCLNNDGFSPLHLAVRSGDLDTIALLFTLNVDVNVRDGRSAFTPLHTAVVHDDLATAACLLAQVTVDVDRRCRRDQTALHYTCWYNSPTMASLLIAAGANVKLQAPSLDEEDESKGTLHMVTPHTIALYKNYKQVLTVLKGDDLQSLDAEGDVTTFEDMIDVGFSKEEKAGDLDRLPYSLRHQLSALLMTPQDPDDDDDEGWKFLAEKLDQFELVPYLQVAADPVVALLDNYELADGTVARLYKSVLDMNRFDLAYLLSLHFSELSGSRKWDLVC